MLNLSLMCPLCGAPLKLYAKRIEDGTHEGKPDPLLVCTCEPLNHDLASNWARVSLHCRSYLKRKCFKLLTFNALAHILKP